MESAEPHLVLPQLQLDDLLSELQSRLQTVRDTRDRVRGLLEAVIAVGSSLRLEAVLRRIVEAAVALVDAQYGALGVIDQDGRLADFIPVGLDEATIAGIDHWPEGRGLLGLLITDPRPLRLADMASHPQSSGFPAGHPPMTSFLGVPIRIRDEVYGNLYLTGKRGGAAFVCWTTAPGSPRARAGAGWPTWPAGPNRTAARSWSGRPAAAGRSCAGRCRCPQRSRRRPDRQLGQRICSCGPRSSKIRAAYAAAWVRRSMPSLANSADT